MSGLFYFDAVLGLAYASLKDISLYIGNILLYLLILVPFLLVISFLSVLSSLYSAERRHLWA